MKGISPVIATTLLIAIAVVGGVTAWYWVASYTAKPPLSEVTYRAFIVSHVYTNSTNNGCNALDIQNVGVDPLNNIVFEIREPTSGKQVGFNGTDSNVSAYVNVSVELAARNTYKYNISMLGNASDVISVPRGTYLLRVSAHSPVKLGLTDHLFVCTGSGPQGILFTYINNNTNEKIDNGVYCSRDTYIMENSKTKFFISLPNITNGTNCSAQLPANYNYLAGTPVRIWTNDAATSYRVSNTILDTIRFYLNNGSSYNMYVDNMTQFNVTNGRIVITPRLSPTSSWFDARITYEMEPDYSNYVKITLTAINKDVSQHSVNLRLSGDQDPPSGTWYNENYSNCGICAGNTCTGKLNATKWIAFVHCGGNDAYGILAPNASIFRIWESSEPEIQSPTVSVNAGAEYNFTFYLVSDLQGPAGQEWKTIEDTYRRIYG